MPVTEITSGDMTVFDSGTVTAFRDAPLEFRLEHPEDEDALELVFEFDDDGGNPRMETEVLADEGKAKLTILNHTDGVDVGPDEPFNLGIIGGRPIHLIYHVNSIDHDSGHTPIFAYTFYLGDELDREEVAGTDG